MSYEIKYSPLAQRDLDDIWTYIEDELKNPKAAASTVSGILHRVSLLATFPESGTPLSSLYPIQTRYRFVISGHYLAFYRFDECVYVDRVLYAGSDYLRILFGDASVSDF